MTPLRSETGRAEPFPRGQDQGKAGNIACSGLSLSHPSLQPTGANTRSPDRGQAVQVLRLLHAVTGRDVLMQRLPSPLVRNSASC